jgi:Tfp pilus assembly protein PilO
MSRNYLEAIVVLIVALGFTFFLTWPRYDALRVVFQKIGEKEAEIKNRQEYYANLEKLANDLKQYQGSLAKISSAFPAKEDAPSLMNFIQATAVESGLILKHIDYVKTDATNNAVANASLANEKSASKRVLRKYIVNADFGGSYRSLKDFVLKIGKSSRMIEVNSIGLKNADNQEGVAGTNVKEIGNSNGNMNFQISFSVNYY